MSDQNPEPEKPQKPFLTIVKGNPTDVEVATLTTLFATMASNAAAASSNIERERNLWGNVSERLQRPATYNPSAFRNVSFY